MGPLNYGTDSDSFPYTKIRSNYFEFTFMTVPTYHWAVCFLLACFLAGNKAGAEDGIAYNESVRPILAEYCFACHGTDAEARQAGLRLDVRDDAVELGAITPGDPDNSELIARICSDDAEMVMPPPETKKKLSALQKQTVHDWIASGAVYQPHWSLVPPVKATLPAIRTEDWVSNPIDYFVLHELERHGLQPAPEQEPDRLFRRLHLDITGLPPSPEQLEAFLADYRHDADASIGVWVDRLMQTSAWGEHRARYWLDAARYADTHGLHFDNYREIWPYRDWTIRAFNANQPFDEFILVQIAGYLLPNPTTDQMIATGFQRCNMTTNEGGTIDEENFAIYAADRVQTLGWVFLGLTTNCCQCHDHKFDPISMKDYYSLAAFFRNTDQAGKDGNIKDGNSPVLMLPGDSDLPRWNDLQREIEDAQAGVKAHRQSVADEIAAWIKSLSAESLKTSIPSDGLLLHAPLVQQPAENDSAGGDEPVPVRFTGKEEWDSAGKFGPAPILRKQQTIILETEVANFAKEQPFSFGAWVKPGHVNNQGAVIARMDRQNRHRGWDLWQNGDGYAMHLIDAWPDNALKVATATSVIKQGQWQHVFVTYDGKFNPSSIRIFVDGRPIDLKTEMNTIKPDAETVSDTPLRLGQRSDAEVFEDAAVQDVRIYDRRLDDREVHALARIPDFCLWIELPDDQISPEQRKLFEDYYLDMFDSEYPLLVEKAADLEREREEIRQRSPITHVQRERSDSQPMAQILIRGEYDHPGEQVTAGTPAALHPFPVDAPQNRLGLARWLTDSRNPLTARVTVNRFWQQIFGQGIVTTSEDFGVMGSLPTHPQLLDWLAVEFQSSGWDVKLLFRLMLTSSTYRQSPAATVDKLEIDPGNQLLARGPRFRMDAEMIRDCALSASGLLSPKMYGPGTRPYQPEEIWNIVGMPDGDTRNYVMDSGENLYRRSIYNFWKRMAPSPNLETLGAPSREVCTVRRERTNTPLQALVTLNDPQFVEAARVLAEHAIIRAGKNDAAIAEWIWTQIVGREMKTREREIILAGKQELLKYYRANVADAAALVSVGQSPVDDNLDVEELAAWTLIGNQILNLDEALSK